MSGGRWKCHFRQQVCGKTIDKCEYNAKITVLEHSVTFEELNCITCIVKLGRKSNLKVKFEFLIEYQAREFHLRSSLS